MKRPSYALILLLLLLTWHPGHAARKTVATGLYGGLSLNGYVGADVEEFKYLVRPTLGVLLVAHLPQILGLETNLLYLYKGSSFQEKLSADSVMTTTIVGHYLEVPLMLKLTIPTDGEVHPIIMGGPSWGFLVAGSTTLDILDLDPSGMVTGVPTTLEPEIKEENLAPVDFGFIIAAGVEWGLGTFQARVNWGRESIDESGGLDLKTLAVSVVAGFTY